MHGVLLNTSPDGTQWGAIAIALVTVIYIAFVRPLRKGKKDPLERKAGDATLAQQRAMERDMSALLVEYEQMMRTMSAQIETRVTKLELLLRDADERLAKLDKALPITKVEATPNASPVATAAPVAVPPAEVERRLLSVLEPESPSHAEVYGLADQGLGYRQIAQRLDRPYGEIELILALRPKTGRQEPMSDTPSEPEPDRVKASIETRETDTSAEEARAEDEERPEVDVADPESEDNDSSPESQRDDLVPSVTTQAEAFVGGASQAGSGQHHGRRRKKRR